MKRLFGIAAMLLVYACMAQAQSIAPDATKDIENASPDLAAGTAAKVPLFKQAYFSDSIFVPNPAATGSFGSSALGSPFALSRESPEPAAPSPKPRFVFGGRDDYHWQLGFGVTWIRFRSSIFNASAVGIRTSVTYFTNSWFGFEGDISAAFAPEIYAKEHVKLLVYGGGPKIAWRQNRWEPWLHALVGGAHEQPQTADNGRNAFQVQFGGGADYRFNPQFSGRLQADYLRTSFFSQSQNNFQLSAGIVIHF